MLNLNRTKDVPDEMLMRQLELKQVAVEEAARDRTFEEFQDSFKAHLEGTADPNERTGGRPATAYDDQGASQKDKGGRQTGMSQNPVDVVSDRRSNYHS